MKNKSLLALGLVTIVVASVAAGAYAASDIKLIINGKSVATTIKVVDGQSYVPLRVVSESLGADVKWDENSRTIAITNSQDSTSKPSTTTPSSDSTKSDEWQTYSNARYGFSVKTPPNWTRGEESTNGDGTKLYIGNPDVDVIVYGTQYMPDISNPFTNAQNSGLKLQFIKLDDGTEADLYIGKSKGLVYYQMFFLENEFEYHFNATVTEEFFKNNEQTFLKVIKSYKAQ